MRVRLRSRSEPAMPTTRTPGQGAFSTAATVPERLDSPTGQDYSLCIHYLIDSKRETIVVEQAVKIEGLTNASVMEVGVDSFAAAFDENSRAVSPSQRLRDLVEQIEHADRVGLDVFGIGEH